MPKDNFPFEIFDLIDRGWVKPTSVLEIDLGDGEFLRLGTSEITYGGHTYQDKLKEVGTIKNSISRAVDRCEIRLDNADFEIGDTLMNDDLDEALDSLHATLYRIYTNISDPTEQYRIELMSGVIYTFVEEEVTDIGLTLITHPYAGGAIARFEARPSCVWNYKDGINCDYSGSLPTCDFTFNGVNGCVAHFGLEMANARFGGGTINLTEEDMNEYSPLDNPPTTGGGGVPGCFLAGTPVLTSIAGKSAPIESFRKADLPIVSFDKKTISPGEDRTAKPAYRIASREWQELIFSDGSELNVTSDHPFIFEGGKRVMARDLKPGEKMRRLVDGRWRRVKLVLNTRIISDEPMEFWNVPVSENETYAANGFPVSNRKWNDHEIPMI